VVPLFDALVRGESPASGTKLPHKKLQTLGYHMMKTRSLYLTLPWIRTGSWQTDRQTDRIPIANTRSQQYLPVLSATVFMLGEPIVVKQRFLTPLWCPRSRGISTQWHQITS